jgi:hypothetical protein
MLQLYPPLGSYGDADDDEDGDDCLDDMCPVCAAATTGSANRINTSSCITPVVARRLGRKNDNRLSQVQKGGSHLSSALWTAQTIWI